MDDFSQPACPLPAVDLTNCEREPIHIPGSIQPHGLLLALSMPAWTIVQVSANSEALLGMSPSQLLGTSILSLCPEPIRPSFAQMLASAATNYNTPLQIPIVVNGTLLYFDGLLHRQPALLLLELENPRADSTPQPASLLQPHVYDSYRLLRRAMEQMQQTTTLADAATVLAQEVRHFTGFDRVMVYRFHPDDHGEVIAEAAAEELEPFLGLHYPASDIPPQARRLYQLNWLRLIADIDYQPAPLVPQANPLTGEPLDLSHSSLRSVSPIHIQYLKNMGVGASMSISLLKEGNLWGLIACHHQTTKFIPFHVRAACEALGTVMSIQLMTKQQSDVVVDLNARLESQTRLLQAVNEQGLAVGLTQGDELLKLTAANGAAVVVDADIYTVGQVPERMEIISLLPWLRDQFRQQAPEKLYHTYQLPTVLPLAANVSKVASGLLAVEISATRQLYLLFFRPEVVQTVNWAGNPNKPVEISADGMAQLSPRRSFDLWRETVYQQAIPWSDADLEQAQALHQAIGRYIIQRADELAVVNQQLEARNTELDSFAYVASHDLKEPLRGIYGHAFFLEEQKNDQLDEESKERISGMMRLTRRMDELLNALLQYSRLGRSALDSEPVDLNQVVSDTREMLHTRLHNVAVRIPQPLPTVQGDYIMLSEVFANLIANATKYNDKAAPWIEIGYTADQDAVRYYVRDNGIGIDERHFDRIFDIFRRLHGRTEFGGGSGAGLAIVKKIIERHGGKIWVESVIGEGTTFYFTLQAGR